MPLTVAIRKDTGTLWITGTVKAAGSKRGVRVRQRAGTDNRTLAEEEAAGLEREILRNHHLGLKPLERGFAEAVKSYLRAEDRSAGTAMLVDRWLRHFRDRKLHTITQDVVDAARDKILRPGASDATWRKTVAILAAVMNHAARRKWCEAPSFDLPRESQGRTRFLLPAEYERLHDAAPRHLKPLLTYLICTGSRLGETLALDWSQVDLSGRRVNVWGDQTKAGRRRVVDLPPAAVRALAGLAHREGRVFLTHKGQIYHDSEGGYGGQIKSAWRTMLRRSGLAGFTPHDLRHTWATWWYALTPDPFRLQQAGGWSSVELVARYAHLLPAGHEAEIRRIWGTEQAAVRVA